MKNHRKLLFLTLITLLCSCSGKRFGPNSFDDVVPFRQIYGTVQQQMFYNNDYIHYIQINSFELNDKELTISTYANLYDDLMIKDKYYSDSYPYENQYGLILYFSDESFQHLCRNYTYFGCTYFFDRNKEKIDYIPKEVESQYFIIIDLSEPHWSLGNIEEMNKLELVMYLKTDKYFVEGYRRHYYCYSVCVIDMSTLPIYQGVIDIIRANM